jgi:hypothetical protein
MKVYIIHHHSFGSMTFGGSSHNTMGTYSSEAGAKKEIARLKDAFLANGSSFLAQDHKDGKGFSYGHDAGSMTFIPGSYSYVEEDVIEE